MKTGRWHVALLCASAVACGWAAAQGPPKPRKFAPPDPAQDVVIRPGAVINLGIPDAAPPGSGTRPENPGGSTGSKPPSDPFGVPGDFGGGRPGAGGGTSGGTGATLGGRPGRTDANQSVTGAYPAHDGAAPPEGLSASGALRIARWAVWRRITDHGRNQPVFTLYGLRVSADGQRIAFCGYEGVRTIRPDGSDYATVSTKHTEEGNLDINADGTRVAWFNGEEGLLVANADGTGRVQLASKGRCHSVRITADGKSVFALDPDMGGIMAYPADGTAGRLLVSTERAAQAVGTDANGNHWRGRESGIDVDGSGKRLVFHFMWDAVALDVRSGVLRRVTNYANPEDRGLMWVRVSWDGSKVGWHHGGSTSDTRYVALQNFDGSQEVRHPGDQTGDSCWGQFSHDGARLITGWGLRIFPSDGSATYNAADLGGINPLNRVQRTAVAATGRRCCVVVEEAVADGINGCAQVYVVEFNPASLKGAPSISGLTVSDPVMKNNLGSAHTVEMQVSGAPLHKAGVVLVRPGAIAPQALRYGMWDGMKDPEGKQPPTSGPRSLQSARLIIGQDQSVPPGPVTVRVFARDTYGRVTVVEAEGMEVK